MLEMREFMRANGKDLLLVEAVQHRVGKQHGRGVARRQRHGIGDDPAIQLNPLESRVRQVARGRERATLPEKIFFGKGLRSQAVSNNVSVTDVPEYEHGAQCTGGEPVQPSRGRGNTGQCCHKSQNPNSPNSARKKPHNAPKVHVSS